MLLSRTQWQLGRLGSLKILEHEFVVGSSITRLSTSRLRIPTSMWIVVLYFNSLIKAGFPRPSR